MIGKKATDAGFFVTLFYIHRVLSTSRNSIETPADMPSDSVKLPQTRKTSPTPVAIPALVPSDSANDTSEGSEFGASAGQIRVVIQNVSPELNGGRFPIKAVPGDVIAVEADIFLDGHDFIAARLLHKHTDDPTWTETAMASFSNDRWGASFIVDRPGRYLYTIDAWVDHLASWQHEVHLKVADGQRITSELLVGAQYADGLINRAGGTTGGKGAKAKKKVEESPDVTALRAMAALFRAGADSAANRYDEAISVAQSEQFTIYANRYPERQHPARYAGHSQNPLSVEVDRTAAGFSTWYCLFPRSAAREEGTHGTFRDVEALLPRIAGMGFDVLYLPPIHPIGTTHRKGKNNSVVSQPGDPGVPYGIGSELGGARCYSS